MIKQRKKYTQRTIIRFIFIFTSYKREQKSYSQKKWISLWITLWKAYK